MTSTLRNSAWTLALALLPLASRGHAAQIDGQVDPDGLTHLPWHDRTPAVPVRSENFEVRFQSAANDLSSARVRQDVVGTPPRYFSAVRVGQRGPYDLWAAQVDGRDADRVLYQIEATDGADTDFLGQAGVGETGAPGGFFPLDFNTFEHAPPGATPATGGVAFRVLAPVAPTAFVRGEFNGFTLAHPMTRQGDEFIAFVPGAAAGDSYKYFFGATSTWKPDAFAKQLDPGDFNNSIVVDPAAYAWGTGPFTPPPFERMVCYQLHVGTFSGLNDPQGATGSPASFADATARVDHLAELGVNVVYLNPVHEWPAAFSGGYNPTTLTAIESALGSPDALKALVDALHARGIAVILDVVYNHFDAGANFLFAYTGPSAADNVFFDTPPADTPFGPQLDLDDPRLRQFVLDAAALMLEEYRMDGFRVDALSAFSFGPQPVASNFLLRDLNDLADARWKDKIMLGEVFGDDPFFTRPTSSGGLGFDSQYHTAFKDAVRSATFNAAFGSPNVGALASAATRSGELSGTRVFNYFELHDDAWPLNSNQRAVRTIDPTPPHDNEFAVSRTKLAHGMTLLAKGIPSLLMGTEWLEDNGWEFEKIDWSQKTQYAQIFRFYSDLIRLRTSREALFADASAFAFHTNETADVFAFERAIPGGDSFVVLANFGGASYAGAGSYRIGLPRAGAWEVALQSDALEYGGFGAGTRGVVVAEPSPLHAFAQSAAFDLPARSFVLLEHRTDPALAGLSTAAETLSVIQGGTQDLSFQAGAQAAGDLRYLLGSLSGGDPGVPLAGLGTLSLNVDNYFLFTLDNPNAGPLSGSLGSLGNDGSAAGGITLGPLSPFSLVGTVARHAYVVIDPATLALTRVSNAVELRLTF